MEKNSSDISWQALALLKKIGEQQMESITTGQIILRQSLNFLGKIFHHIERQ
jgi:hypothetical protein